MVFYPYEEGPCIEDLRVLLFPVELPEIACSEKTQPYDNNGFACSRALSYVTMSEYAAGL